MEGMESKGSLFRINNCASDLLSIMEDDLIEEEDEDYWELMGRDLRLKSTFIYCDFSKVISSSRDGEHKKNLTDLANRLFYYMEGLCEAVKSRSIPETQNCYSDAVVVLQEVVAATCQKNEMVVDSPVSSDQWSSSSTLY